MTPAGKARGREAEWKLCPCRKPFQSSRKRRRWCKECLALPLTGRLSRIPPDPIDAQCRHFIAAAKAGLRGCWLTSGYGAEEHARIARLVYNEPGWSEDEDGFGHVSGGRIDIRNIGRGYVRERPALYVVAGGEAA